MEQKIIYEIARQFSHAQRASLYRKIQALPEARGVAFCETLAIGERYSSSALLFGPGMTFESWEAMEGTPIQGVDTALTNPLRATQWAVIPDVWRSHPGVLEHLIKAEEALMMDELPRLWVGRKRGNGIRINDLFKHEDGRSMKVLTFGEAGNRFLVCPLEWYSDDKETDKGNPNYGYRKHHDKWVWMTMADLYGQGYRMVTSATNELFCILVADKKDERGIE